MFTARVRRRFHVKAKTAAMQAAIDKSSGGQDGIIFIRRHYGLRARAAWRGIRLIGYGAAPGVPWRITRRFQGRVQVHLSLRVTARPGEERGCAEHELFQAFATSISGWQGNPIGACRFRVAQLCSSRIRLLYEDNRAAVEWSQRDRALCSSAGSTDPDGETGYCRLPGDCISPVSRALYLTIVRMTMLRNTLSTLPMACSCPAKSGTITYSKSSGASQQDAPGEPTEPHQHNMVRYQNWPRDAIYCATCPLFESLRISTTVTSRAAHRAETSAPRRCGHGPAIDVDNRDVNRALTGASTYSRREPAPARPDYVPMRLLRNGSTQDLAKAIGVTDYTEALAQAMPGKDDLPSQGEYLIHAVGAEEDSASGLHCVYAAASEGPHPV